MKKTDITALAQDLIKLVTSKPDERQNLVEWAESYLSMIEIKQVNKQQCQYCERAVASFIKDMAHPEMSPDLICKKCLLIDLFEYLEAMKDVRYP